MVDCPIQIRVAGNALTGPSRYACSYTGGRCVPGDYCEPRCREVLEHEDGEMDRALSLMAEAQTLLVDLSHTEDLPEPAQEIVDQLTDKVDAAKAALETEMADPTA